MNISNQLDLIRLDLPAAYKFLNLLGVCIESLLEQGSEPSDIDLVVYDIKLAVHEVCINIIEHAYGSNEGRIDIVLSLAKGPRQFIVDLHDTGRSFSLPEICQPNQGEIQTSGYGLFLIHRLMDNVDYHPLTGNNHWRLMKQL